MEIDDIYYKDDTYIVELSIRRNRIKFICDDRKNLEKFIEEFNERHFKTAISYNTHMDEFNELKEKYNIK